MTKIISTGMWMMSFFFFFNIPIPIIFLPGLEGIGMDATLCSKGCNLAGSTHPV